VILATRFRVPWFAVAVAAVLVRLSKVRASDSVLIWFLAANWARAETLRTPANLATELPLRFDLAGITFSELVRSVARSIGRALAHQGFQPDTLASAMPDSGVERMRTYVNIISFSELPQFAGCRSSFHVLSTGRRPISRSGATPRGCPAPGCGSSSRPVEDFPPNVPSTASIWSTPGASSTRNPAAEFSAAGSYSTSNPVANLGARTSGLRGLGTGRQVILAPGPVRLSW
jgi:hypothetical protein